jgi:Fe-S-cluster containining protein
MAPVGADQYPVSDMEEGDMREALKRVLSDFWAPATKDDTRCLCCGDCCREFGGHLNACRSDLERWRREGRDDLLCRVNRLGWIWVDPETGHLLDPCPFLRPAGDDTTLCDIQETKPAMCRDYPTLAHGRRCLRGVFLKGALPLMASAACGVDTLLWTMLTQ